MKVFDIINEGAEVPYYVKVVVPGFKYIVVDAITSDDARQRAEAEGYEVLGVFAYAPDE